MAAMKAVDPRVTYAELEQWPDDGRRYELYGGEVIVVPAPVPIHQVVALRLYTVLDEHARKTGGFALASPLDIVFSEYDVLQPDVVFFDAERRHRLDLRSAIRIVPNLVVEVLSRSTAARDRGRKRSVFANYGVPEYWIVDPSVKTLEVLRNTGREFDLIAAYQSDALIVAATLPGLTFELAILFHV
jgi:Uma2 family endonuclease